MEFSLISRRRRRFQSDTKSGRFILPTGRPGDFTKFRESPGESGRLNMYGGAPSGCCFFNLTNRSLCRNRHFRRAILHSPDFFKRGALLLRLVPLPSCTNLKLYIGDKTIRKSTVQQHSLFLSLPLSCSIICHFSQNSVIQMLLHYTHNQPRHATWYGLSVSNTDFGRFGADTAVSRCDTDLRQIIEKQFRNMCSETIQFYCRHN